MWYWIGGSTDVYSPATAALSLPPGRLVSEFSTSPSSPSANATIYFYGGQGYNSNMNVVAFADMWELEIGMNTQVKIID
jgi:hypothetical protein